MAFNSITLSLRKYGLLCTSHYIKAQTLELSLSFSQSTNLASVPVSVNKFVCLESASHILVQTS